jgi:hypothetical protein
VLRSTRNKTDYQYEEKNTSVGRCAALITECLFATLCPPLTSRPTRITNLMRVWQRFSTNFWFYLK